MDSSGRRIVELLPGCRITTKFCDSSFGSLIVLVDCFQRVCMFVCFFLVLVAINFVIKFSLPLLSIPNFVLPVRIASIVAGSYSSSRIWSSKVLAALILRFSVS